ncbi:MAG: hypothetical protein A2W90_16505 [Bacteroidetes bacterium GWF2_42_66]|nr:MAG: hypothetical protein A2W92_04110 [Bacteroidetes bacterium GWA2_42_15]OFX96295.1 MAG: hypothetical protein A2W89_05435 [Bacteroidetes bacterium GWE2_42_39]OFY46334.1 MAG: hypothetical protein A2W90_16505 [Bacteroidetes bacterium GWF2_42_66]HAZ03454.1 hypothetical protein [Marinilabiliales bacterium]HBL78280.1 hypothetical protein [Prolixibacteraceae bacterium]
METLKINVINQDALAILRAMEQAGLIVFPEKDTENKNLSKQLRGTISSSRAKKMIEIIEKERSEWDQRY